MNEALEVIWDMIKVAGLFLLFLIGFVLIIGLWVGGLIGGAVLIGNLIGHFFGEPPQFVGITIGAIWGLSWVLATIAMWEELDL